MLKYARRSGAAHALRKESLNRVNHKISSGINMNRLLADGKPLEINDNGVINLDYSNPQHRKIAEAWLSD